LLDDVGVLTQRAQQFLSDHGRRGEPVQGEFQRERYECTDADGGPVPGPDGGLDRLQAFIAQYAGLSFCQERPGCNGKHTQTYRFDDVVRSGWTRTASGGWVAEVGELEVGERQGWALMLDWSSGRIGIDIHQPETWIAHSLVNLLESAALGQSLYLSSGWRKAALQGRGPGWGVGPVALERLQTQVSEVSVASSPWNTWLMDQDVAVHGWQATYEPTRQVAVMAWYRTPEGRRRIETAAGPLAPH
jgi:hypothetical protein